MNINSLDLKHIASNAAKITGAFALMVGAYALAEDPAPSCEELAEVAHWAAEARTLRIPGSVMLSRTHTPEAARLVRRVYEDRWPLAPARRMATRLCEGGHLVVGGQHGQ